MPSEDDQSTTWTTHQTAWVRLITSCTCSALSPLTERLKMSDFTSIVSESTRARDSTYQPIHRTIKRGAWFYEPQCSTYVTTNMRTQQKQPNFYTRYLCLATSNVGRIFTSRHSTTRAEFFLQIVERGFTMINQPQPGSQPLRFGQRLKLSRTFLQRSWNADYSHHHL